MKNQLFKTLMESIILWDFLKEIGDEEEDYYILSKPLYKKAVFNNKINQFIKKIEEFYYDSNKYFLLKIL